MLTIHWRHTAHCTWYMPRAVCRLWRVNHTVTKKGTACVQPTVNGAHNMYYLLTVLIFSHAILRLVVIEVAHLVIPLSTKYYINSLWFNLRHVQDIIRTQFYKSQLFVCLSWGLTSVYTFFFVVTLFSRLAFCRRNREIWKLDKLRKTRLPITVYTDAYKTLWFTCTLSTQCYYLRDHCCMCTVGLLYRNAKICVSIIQNKYLPGKFFIKSYFDSKYIN